MEKNNISDINLIKTKDEFSSDEIITINVKFSIQGAKNFEPFIRLTEEEVRQELFDFDEKITFKASELGNGKHAIGAEAYVEWQKHDYTEPFSTKFNTKEIEIKIN